MLVKRRKSIRENSYEWIFLLLGGLLVGIFTALVLSGAKKVWIFLIVAGVLGLTGSLFVKDPRKYFMGFFVFLLPLHIKKVLISDVSFFKELVDSYGYPPGVDPMPILYLSDLPFLALLLLWIWNLSRGKEKFDVGVTFWFGVFFLLWSILSMKFAPMKNLSFWECFARFKYLVFFLYFSNAIRSAKEIQFVAKFLVVGLAIQGMVGVFNYYNQSIQDPFGNLFGNAQVNVEESEVHLNISGEEGDKKFRAGGTVAFANPNSQGQYNAIVLPFSFYLFILARKFWERVFWLSCGLLGLAGLIVTFSRGALLAFLVSCMMIIIFGTYRKLISIKYLIAVVIGIIAAVPFVYIYMTTRVEYFYVRFPLWEMALSIISDHPIFGGGVNNAVIVGSQYPDPEYVFFGAHFHNHFLTTAVEIGIVGLILYCSVFLSMFLRSFKSFLKDRDDLYHNWLSVLMPATVAGTATHLFADNLASVVNATLIWVVTGLGISLHRLKQQSQALS